MDVTDLDTLDDGQIIQTDLCIIGGGPAGLTIAREFFGTNVQTLIVESGLSTPDPRIDAMSEIESVGAPRIMDQAQVRNRVLGGTSHSWSGRCAPFDAIDLAARPWVPFSGWPIGYEDLRPFLDRACPVLGLGASISDERMHELSGRAGDRNSLDPALLEHCFWQYSSDTKHPRDFMRFGPHFAAAQAPNVKVLVNATTTELRPDRAASGKGAIEVVSINGTKAIVKSKILILTAGGLENARIMLVSRKDCPNGIGNEHDVVGRFLMDHPRCTLGSFGESDVAAIRERYGLFRVGNGRAGHYFSQGIRLAPALQSRDGLLNSAAWLTEDRAEDDPWDAAKRLLSGPRRDVVRDGWRVVSHPQLVARGLTDRVLRGRGLPHKLQRLKLDCIVEQRPDPQSRLTLGEKVDRLGLPVARLDWRISEQEKVTVATLGELVHTEFKRIGLPAPSLADWVRTKRTGDADFVDVSHPTGATRMSVDPRVGVVDRNCRVHGVGGLYVAGSSVFPTSGHANPTQMIVALAVRLADHLKQVEFGTYLRP